MLSLCSNFAYTCVFDTGIYINITVSNQCMQLAQLTTNQFCIRMLFCKCGIKICNLLICSIYQLNEQYRPKSAFHLYSIS